MNRTDASTARPGARRRPAALVVAAALAACVAVSAAVAAPPPGASRSTDAKPARAAAKPTRPACKPVVALVLRGTYVSGAADAAGAGAFQMLVASSNRHARALVGKEATVRTNAATVVRRNGAARLADLRPGDRLNVHVRACRADDAATLELQARRVVATPAKPDAPTGPADTTDAP